jgi:hypothetical protein
MKTIWKTSAVIAAVWLALPLSATARSDEPNENGIEALQGIAAGLGVNVPLVGRLVGGGNTLYISTVDVTNNTATDAQVDFYLDGQDLASGAAISRVGSISSSGTLVAQGAGGSCGTARTRTSRTSSTRWCRPAASRLRRVGRLHRLRPLRLQRLHEARPGLRHRALLQLLRRRLDRAVAERARHRGGRVAGRRCGLSRLPVPVGGAAALRQPVHQQHGTDSAGAGTSGSVTVRLQAYANSTGNPIGTAVDLTIGAGQTASVSDVLHRLGIPAGEDTILVTATVTSGSAAIAGAAVQIDQTTKDGSVVEMNRGDF